MKYVLIILAFSSWDWSFKSRTEGGIFASKAECEFVAKQLRENSDTHENKYFCSEQKSPNNKAEVR